MKLAAAAQQELHHAVLHHLGVHFEGRYVGTLVESVEHGIGNVAHTALDGQERLGHAALLHLVDEEVAHVLADAAGGVVDRSELALLAQWHVAVDHTQHLLGVDVGHRLAGGVGAVGGEYADIARG